MMSWLSLKMTQHYNFAILLALISIISAADECREYENTQYTYRVCPNTGIRNFNQSREHCRGWHRSADLMTFPTEHQFEFIKKIMNETAYELSPTAPPKLYAFIGIYQKQNDVSVFNPETGEFYWVTNPQQRITNKSGDFYYPFASWIEYFNEGNLVRKHRQTLILSSEGEVWGGTSFGQQELNGNIENIILICSRPGVTTTQTKQHMNNDEESDDNLVKLIAIIAGSVVGLICLILIIAFVCRKCDQGGSHLFAKVPQQELTPTNSTYAQKV